MATTKVYGAAAKKVIDSAIRNVKHAARNIEFNNYDGAIWDLQDAIERLKQLIVSNGGKVA